MAVSLGCGGYEAPTSVPTPTPSPPGSIRFIDATIPAGSTVEVSPLLAVGQQAPQLSFRAAITLNRSVPGTLVRAWVRTDALRCMGGGLASVDFQAGVERAVQPASMSNSGSGLPMCPLPYATTHVEFEVIDSGTGQPLLSQSFPAAYNFVAER